jgi:hypothetical protein
VDTDAGAGDRGRLLGFARQYVDALVAHDHSRAPLAPGVKLTEDGQRLPVGAGLVRTITGASGGGRRFADPASGQVGLRTGSRPP